MKRVGVVPFGRLHETDEYYEDQYSVHNNFARHITAQGGIPMGVLPMDGFVSEEALSCYDSFVICGGKRIFPYHIQVMDHAVRTGKPVLGICLGMQTIHNYFVTADEAKRRNWEGSILELFNQMKKERYFFVEPVEHHSEVHIMRNNIEETKHVVKVANESYLAELLGIGDEAKSCEDGIGEASPEEKICEVSPEEKICTAHSEMEIRAASLHRYRVTQVSEQLRINALAPDGTVEGIEYGRQILGVQFHPEVDMIFNGIFRHVT